jgi:glutamate racemase
LKTAWPGTRPRGQQPFREEKEMDRNAPIGVFDSGVGGLTVAREIMRQMPMERLVYFGDTARVPYGTKSQDTVIRYSRQIIRFLQTKEVKAIVIACNTATACALETVEKDLDIPIIGVIHAGAKAAVEATKNGKIGIIGTEATIRSGVYTELMKQMNPDIEVTGKPCPLFVPLVEEGLLHDSVTDEIAGRYLAALKEKYIDTLVMGCTHYPLLRSTLGRLMGEDVTLINPAYETAMELRGLLKEKGLDCSETGEGEKYQFYVSDMAERFKDFATAILPGEVKETKKINIEEY